MGSKAKLMSKISELLQANDNFYDLFGGGFAVTHFMLENRFNHFKEFHFNEILLGMTDFVKDAIVGKYNYNNNLPDWIDRETFHREKSHNAYIRCVWSFGNNQRDYLFGKEIEHKKRSAHQAVVFNEFDDFMKNEFKIDSWPENLKTIKEKRLHLKKITKSIVELQQLQRLQQLDLNYLKFYNTSYENIEIKKNSTIYCDIPYKNTAKYCNEFDHKKFLAWADAQKEPVYISEYNIDDKRFFLIKEMNHTSSISAIRTNKVIEKLYCNKAAFERLR